MSLTPKELQLHRELIVMFNEYIKHNLRWEEKHYDTDAIRARKALRRLIDVAYLRWKEIHNSRDNREEEPLTIGNEFFRDLAKKASGFKKRKKNNTKT